MPLTPQDVHSKVFGPTRLRRGYDEGEVDAFLDEVEVELTRLHREIDSLRGRAGDAAPGETAPSDAVPGGDEVGLGQGADGQSTADGGPAGAVETTPAVPAVQPAQGAAQSGGQPGEPADLEQRVARALVLAQRAADEAVRDAERQAEELRAAAAAEADRITSEARAAAERQRAELQRTRAEAEGGVEQLRAFEREYRTRLRAYLQLQLSELDQGAPAVEQRQASALGARSADEPGQVQPADDDEGEVLLTSELPANDPAVVPAVAADSNAPEVPRSIPVTDPHASAGIRRVPDGEELQHESRGLHDDL